MAIPHDTAPDAWARYLQAVRAIEPAERVRLATTMSDELREVTRAGIRARHPEWSEAEVARSLDDIVVGGRAGGTAGARRVAEG